MLKEGRGKSLIVNTPRRIRVDEIRQTSSKWLVSLDKSQAPALVAGVIDCPYK